VKLSLSHDLTLPLRAVTEKLAWIGTTGSGKTYGASKLAELYWDAGAQFVVLDPVGVWYGLRLQADGKKPSSMQIPIFGGLHGDIPLEPTGGALVADLIVDRTISVILDVSQFESDALKARFSADFVDRLFFKKKSAPSALHLFVEECQEFVPQHPQKGEERMLHVFTRVQKLGRNFGIGSSYITQRPQEVHKKALNLAQTLFVFRTTGPHERKALTGWMEDKGLDQDIAGDLPKLQTGTCHVWSPEFLEISKVIRILPKHTFNASATPEVGAKTQERNLAPIDLEKVRTEMAATIEKAKADDPRELRKTIARLREENRKLQGSLTKVPAPKIETTVKEVPILKDAQVRHLEQAVARLEAVGQQVGSLVTEIRKDLQKVSSVTCTTASQPRATATQSFAHSQTRKSIPSSAGQPSGELGKGERQTLVAIAQYPEGVTREQLTVLTGYKRSTRNTYLQRLCQWGYAVSRGDRIVITDPGMAVLGPDFEPLPTGDALRSYWLARLPEGERRILELLASAYPYGVSREELSEQTGYARSSRNTYLQRMHAKALIACEEEAVRAKAELFG
jgi:hypothetical protein